MSIDRLHTLSSLHQSAPGRNGTGSGSLHSFKVGERFELTVLERAGHRRYRVQLGDARREVRSSAELTPGARLQVQVMATGPRLLLQGVDSAAVEFQELLEGGEPAGFLEQLALQHLVVLDAQDLGIIQRNLQGAEDPRAMAEAGLFLGKLGLALDATSMQAIYLAQAWSPVLTGSSGLARSSLSVRVSGSPDTNTAAHGEGPVDGDEIEALAQQLQQLLSAATGEGTDDRDERHERPPHRALACELLNTHDGGSVGYRYGVLPLLVADQLVELDLVRFHTPSQNTQPALQRLTMTLNSAALGPVEIDVRAFGPRLELEIRAASAASSATLEYADEVRALVVRLGWDVEGLSYDHDAQLPRAATHLVRHVLRADTLSRLL